MVTHSNTGLKDIDLLLHNYDQAVNQTKLARRDLLNTLKAQDLVLAQPDLYIGPNPFGKDTKLYDAVEWRMVTGPHAKKYTQAYIEHGIIKPEPKPLTKEELEEFNRPSLKPNPKHRIAKGYDKRQSTTTNIYGL